MPPLQVAVRLGVTALVVVAPTAMFLGLWRLLLRMRDGELVGRVLEDERVGEGWTSGRFAEPPVLTMLHPIAPPDGPCRHCGVSNPQGTAVCPHCLGRR
jgi:hypothetical protein